MTTNRNWFPIQQAAFLTYAQNFAGVLASAPTDYGCTSSDATGVTTLLNTFETKFALSEAPETRTPVTIAQKDIAMKALIADMRRVHKKVRAANVSADKLIELGLKPIDNEPSPVPVPGTQPVLLVRKVEGRTVEIGISDELTPGKRAKPDGVASYQFFSHAGENAPAELSEWTLEGQGTRFVLAVTLPASVEPGTKVWFAARWLNAKQQAGPVSAPVATFIGGGSVSEAA